METKERLHYEKTWNAHSPISCRHRYRRRHGRSGIASPAAEICKSGFPAAGCCTSEQVAYDQQQMAAQMEAMQQQQAALAQQAQAQPAQVAAPAADDTITQLQKLAELQKAGIITEAEFTAKKKQLLGI